MSDPVQEEQANKTQLNDEFELRKKRLEDAISLKKPDRVPVAPLAGIFYPTRIKGISNKDNMYNPAGTFQAWIEAAVQHNWDVALPPMLLFPVRVWEQLQIIQMKWPGGGLSDDQPFQWVENEYAKQAEYDEMLTNPDSFAVKTIWPRIAGALSLFTSPPSW